MDVTTKWSSSISAAALHGDAVADSSMLARAALLVHVVATVVLRFSHLNSYLVSFCGIDFLVLAEVITVLLALVTLVLCSGGGNPSALPLVVVLGCLLAASSIRTGSRYLAVSMLVVMTIGQSGCSIRGTIELYAVASIAGWLTVTFLSLFGVIANYDTIPNSRLVFSYGFGHPNTCGALLANGLAALTIAYWDRKTWIVPCVLSGLASIFCWCVLSANADTVLNVSLFISAILGHMRVGNRAFGWVVSNWSALLILVPLVLLITMVVFCVLGDCANPFFEMFNKILHGRPYYSHQYFLRNGGLSLFGRPYIAESYYKTGLPFSNLDSGYSQLVLVNGCAPTIAMIALYIKSVRRALSDGVESIMWITVIMSSLFLMLESFGLTLGSSVAMLVFAYAFSGGPMAKEECTDA